MQRDKINLESRKFFTEYVKGDLNIYNVILGVEFQKWGVWGDLFGHKSTYSIEMIVFCEYNCLFIKNDIIKSCAPKLLFSIFRKNRMITLKFRFWHFLMNCHSFYSQNTNISYG